MSSTNIASNINKYLYTAYAGIEIRFPPFRNPIVD